jgi:iron complex outermembrane receptor protein
MFVAIVFLALAALLPVSLIVTDEAGKTLAAASVDFTDAAGNHDVETTDAAGRATASSTFDAVAATVKSAGFGTVRVSLHAGEQRVALEHRLSTIGTVAVATGAQRNVHELPVATALLDSTAIAGIPVASSDRLLRDLPGSDYMRSNAAFTNYGQLRTSFSGAGTDRGAVLVDGIPAQDAFGGQVDWLAYPNDELERAELLRGAGSALYGSGAVGGVLDLQTFGPQVGASGADGTIDVGAGSNAERDDALLVRTSLGPKFAASLVATDSQLEYRDLAPGYQTPIDRAARATSGITNLRLRYASGGTTVDVAGLFASDGQDEGRKNYSFDRTLRQQSIVATRALGTTAGASLGFYSRDTTVYNIDDKAPTAPGVLRYIQHVPTHEDGFFATLGDRPGPFDYQLRVDQRRVYGSSLQTGPPSTVQSFGTGSELLQGIAAQVTYRAGRFEALAGARADNLRYDDLLLLKAPKPPTSVPGHNEGAISPRVALRYDLTHALAVRVSSGGGFRGPYINELVRGFNIGKVFEAPNPYLVPERSRTDSAGLDYLVGRGRLSFDFVETHVNDAIAFVTISPTLMMRENIDRTQTESETVAYAERLGACSRLRVSGTAQTPRVTNGPTGTIGKQLSYVPNSSADIGIDAGGHGALSYSVDGAYIGQTYADSLQTEPLGAALLFGGTLRATTTSGTTFELTGDNLTHQTYLSSIDRYGPPLTISLHVGLPIGGPASHPASCP